MKRILLIDDHIAVRAGLRNIIGDLDPSICFGEAADPSGALDQARIALWHAAILDLNLPGRGGLDLLSELKQAQPTMAILVYTMHPEFQFGVRCMARGASGYLMKEAPAAQVSAAIATLLAGRKYITPALAEALAETSMMGPRFAHERLSDREHEVLRLLAEGYGVNEIARNLMLSPKTISTHRLRILQKLNLRTNAEMVRYALEYRLIGPGK